MKGNYKAGSRTSQQSCKETFKDLSEAWESVRRRILGEIVRDIKESRRRNLKEKRRQLEVLEKILEEKRDLEKNYKGAVNLENNLVSMLSVQKIR